MSKLFLIPTPISEDTSSIPPQSNQIIKKSRVFVCERVRTSRRFIKSILKDFDIDGSTFIEIDKKGDLRQNSEIIDVLKDGKELCFMSEAGSPCIADPGAKLVNMARENDYKIVAVSGPSALLLALMSSGMDGQHFTFRGYLPVKTPALIKELKYIEKTIQQTGYTQMFIETPYRNLQMFESILQNVGDHIRMNISYNLHSESEYTNTQNIKNWKKDNRVRTIIKEKNPCIFLLGK